MVYNSNSTEETKIIGFDLAKKLDTGAIKSKFIALRGEMGVGKTAFTAGFCEYFGAGGVKSPTYTIVLEYVARDGRRIFHFDMYRIGSEDDLLSIGYDELIDSGAYSIVEWSENIDGFIPDDAVYVTIERVDGDDQKRRIIIEE